MRYRAAAVGSCLSRDIAVVESDDNDEANAPSSTSTVIMKVRSSVTLECGFVAAAAAADGEVYAEWKKNETVLKNSRKYLITHDADKSSLTVVGTGTIIRHI